MTDPDELTNVYLDDKYCSVREQLKADMWRAQESLGDEPHPSQPRPAGV